MNKFETAKQVFRDGDFIATTRQLLDAGIHTSYIAQLVRSGEISRIRRGVYEWTVSGRRNDVEIISRLLPDAILCMETMLHHYGYSDRTPEKWHVAVDRRLNRERLKIAYPPLRVHYVAPGILEVGLTESVIDDVKVRVYDRERTICDVIRRASKMEAEAVAKAIQAYVRDGQKNTSRMLKYAVRFRIQRRVRDLVGVWF